MTKKGIRKTKMKWVVMIVMTGILALAAAILGGKHPWEDSVRLKSSAPPAQHALSLWYRQPGALSEKLSKTSDSLPIGNGRLGAMVSGGVASEQLQFNEESLWSGGPGGREGYEGDAAATELYNFGYEEKSPDRNALYALLKNGATSGDDGTQGVDVTAIEGNYNGYGSYKNFGILNLDYLFADGKIQVENYRRELDLEDGVARVQFSSDEITYKREYVASYPDNAIAVHLRSDEVCKVNLRLSITPGQAGGKITVANNTLTLSGCLADNGLCYAAVFFVKSEGGMLSASEEAITVTNADSVTIYFSAATDYQNEYTLPEGSQMFEKLTYRTGESLQNVIARVTDTVQAAASKDYSEFLQAHKADYQALFGRVNLDVGGENDVPTDKAIEKYKFPHTPQANKRMLETLLYQYGRYLLIASSREGALPANLQGKWNPQNTPPWGADYHTNINLQMNYWPAGGANLLETMQPLQAYTQSLMVTGRYTAQKYSYASAEIPKDAWQEDGAGWATHVSGNIFGLTVPGSSWGWGWSPAANAFLSQNLYQYLQYGGDPVTFQRDYWPIIREAAVMWTKALYKPTDGLWKGKYVALPSFSPEHGPLTVATAYDQQLIWELFTLTLDCMKQLGIEEENKALKEDITEKLANLSPAVNIGKHGIMEWSESNDEFREYDRKHRHMSQMVGFYPGTSIADGSKANFDAAVKTLNWRGDGATGWSMGWKINLWARALDGNRAHKLIENLIEKNLATNLFGLHKMGNYPPDGYCFQIDANFGYTAGVQEMLLQSHLDAIHLLPALPEVWQNGSVRGLRTIGGHEVAMQWKNGSLTSATVTAFSTGELKLCSAALQEGSVSVNGQAAKVIDGCLTIAATKGVAYQIQLT